MDVMEHTAITDVVVLETVLEEVKHLSMAAYTRLRALINNPTRRFFVLLNEHHRCEACCRLYPLWLDRILTRFTSVLMELPCTSEMYTEKAAGESPNDRNDRGSTARRCSLCLLV